MPADTEVIFVEDLIFSFPIIPIGLGLIGLLWILFSFAMVYHWVLYNRNLPVTIFVLALHFSVSLALLGYIVITLSAYAT